MPRTPIAELEAQLEAAGAAAVAPAERVDALNALAWELRNNEVTRAHALATEARELARGHGYLLGRARATRTMAMTIADSESLREVFSLAEEARHLFDEAGDDHGRAGSRDFLASLYEHVGDLAGGLELALDALSIARRLGDPVRQGYALSSVGGILTASGEVDVAVERLQEALQLFEGVQDLVGISTICVRLCKVLQSAGRTDEALPYAERCRQLAELTGEEFARYSAFFVMAQLEDARGHAVESARLYRAALGCLSTQVARNVMGAEGQVALGRLLLRQGALEEARRELEQVLGWIEGDSISVLNEAAAHEALAELCERQGTLAPAIEHLRKAQTLRERIAQRDARNKLAQVEARAAIEAAEKDAEIHKLRFVELHAVQSKLVEAEKMALLGKLAAGAAHELNTPLGVLRSNTKLSATAIERLVALLGGAEEIGAQATRLAAVLASCRETTDEAMERIAAVAQSFGRFSQLDYAESRPFDVRDGVGSALALLEPTIPDAITVERRFEQVPEIRGWPRELNHAFMTVLQNAVHAIDGAGVVSAETGVTDTHVLVRVRDTGRGMSEEQAAHLFDVGWSEDGARTRMRLGLSAAYTTTQKHGGTIEVESALGQGTQVTFRFPIPGARG